MQMQPQYLERLGRYVRGKRAAAGLTLRQLEARSGIDHAWISRLERGEYIKPDPRYLARLADALDVEVTDLYPEAGYQTGSDLPGFEPYLRARYDFPDDAVEQLKAHFNLINARYQTQSGGHARDRR